MSHLSKAIDRYMEMIDDANNYLDNYEMEYMKKDKKISEKENKFLIAKSEAMSTLYYASLELSCKEDE